MNRSQMDSVNSYIASFPESTRALLTQMRETIRNAAPDASEVISYQMPAFKLKRVFVWFAGYKNHIGFYPGASGIANFKPELARFKSAKGSVQFPLDEPLPLDLVARIVKFRVDEAMQKPATKVHKRICPNGHTYAKSSDCPTCPECERLRKPGEGFLSLLPAPARRALESKGIQTLEQLAGHSEKEILCLHGMGPGSLPKLRAALQDAELAFEE